MGVNIKLPYLEISGESQISVFSKMHFIATTVTNYLISAKGGFFVDDAVSFLLRLGGNFLNVADTFLNIAKSKKILILHLHYLEFKQIISLHYC